MIKYVTYYRVSTLKQEHGIPAQRSYVENFVNGKGEILKEFSEKESGKNDNRIQLNLAIEYAKEHQATLIVKSLDRLSRRVSFLFDLVDTLKSASVEIVVADCPDMIGNTLMLGIYATFSQHEREQISIRTKAGLKIARANGKVLGRPLGTKLSQATRNMMSVNIKASKAAIRLERCSRAIEIAKTSRKYGATWVQICSQLNDENVPTVRGLTGKWTPPMILRLVQRTTF